MLLRLVGTRSRAIRRRTSEKGANGKTDREEPQLRKRLKHLTYKVHAGRYISRN
jgi:hypothetical protein